MLFVLLFFLLMRPSRLFSVGVEKLSSSFNPNRIRDSPIVDWFAFVVVVVCLFGCL